MSAAADTAVWEFPIDWSKVREFAHAVHDDHWNEEPLAVPPTFLVMLSAEYLERIISRCSSPPAFRRTFFDLLRSRISLSRSLGAE